MKKTIAAIGLFGALAFAGALQAQDLGADFTQVKDGIYVYAAKEGNSNCSVVLTQEGPVIIDTCQSPPDAHRLAAAVKKLTDKPVRFIIDTEVHSDHTFNHFVFSPPAIVINHVGAGEGMRKTPIRNELKVFGRSRRKCAKRSRAIA